MSKGYSSMFYGTNMAKAVAGEIVLKSPNYKYFDNISKRKDIDPGGVFDVVAHGMANSVQIEVNGVSVLANARDISRILSHSSKYKYKKPIRLLSCNTGSISNGFAQNLANKLNVVVYAPTDIVWAYPNGKYIVAAKSNSVFNGPDLSKKGKFVAFYPGGKKK